VTITIRPATLSDEWAVLELIEELFAPTGSRPPRYDVDEAREAVRRTIGNEHSDVLLAVDGDTAVGMLAIYVDFLMIRYGLRCWLEDFVVLPSQRSRGIGKALLETAAEWARTHGCTHIQLNSFNGRVDVHRFYVANGMTQDSLSFSLQVADG
jgi:GNAT superfamily N-acetyltransferase